MPGAEAADLRAVLEAGQRSGKAHHHELAHVLRIRFLQAAASGALDVTGEGAVDDWWRAVAAAAWEHLDTTGHVADVGGLTPPSSVEERRAGAGGTGRSEA